MVRRLVLPVLAALVIPLVGWTPPAVGAGAAKVRIVDHYDHGRVRITFDNVDETMHEGDRTG